MKRLSVILAATGIAAFSSLAQDHGHLNVGATGTNQNDALLFANGPDFDIVTHYVKTLVHTNSGRYAGYFVGNLTHTALAATVGHSAYSPDAAAFGSWIFSELTSVEGPAGGEFAFWENGATTPTLSLPCGTTGTNLFPLTQTDGAPGTDPYGHIHGRRFTATLPGIYTVSFRARDLSTNGSGGGPIHSSSGMLKIYFQAGVNLKGIVPLGDHTQVTFSAPVGNAWVVESSDSLGTNANWTPISAPITGDDYFHEITDDHEVSGPRFYRTRGQ